MIYVFTNSLKIYFLLVVFLIAGEYKQNYQGNKTKSSSLKQEKLTFLSPWEMTTWQHFAAVMLK